MLKRRSFNQWLLSLPALGLLRSGQTLANKGGVLMKTIPSSGQQIPAVGMGTWITFDHDPERIDLTQYVEILEAFFAGGGQMIDSSPMYGFAQQLLGATLPQVKLADKLFAATKVWVPGQQMGRQQMQQSIDLWKTETMDLMHVHNMLDWQAHWPTLKEWQNKGRIKYTGITTSHGRRHADLLRFLSDQSVDFVQFTYNIHDREAEEKLLPLAQARGVAVVINRPFQGGGLFARVNNKPLPPWAAEIQCHSWSQFFLKFIISHPAVTCAIPATSQLSHMQENMLALTGDMPDQDMRQAMVDYYQGVI